MNQQAQAQRAVLQRIMHLLEERSVSSAMAGDQQFAAFIERLYERVEQRAGGAQT